MEEVTGAPDQEFKGRNRRQRDINKKHRREMKRIWDAGNVPFMGGGGRLSQQKGPQKAPRRKVRWWYTRGRG